MKRTALILAVVIGLVASVRGQGFINLDFESASTGSLTNNAFVAVSNAVPGWAVNDGPNPLSEIYYETNHPDAGTAVVLNGGGLALGGNYSVWLGPNASLRQSGLVPGDTESLRFFAHGNGAGGSLGASGFNLSLGGQTLPFSVLSQSSGYWIYGANIPAGMAGHVEVLNFFISGPGSGNVILDNIAFSTLSVPEPTGFALLGLSAILFRLVRQKSQR
jgi:hypothetical protein